MKKANIIMVAVVGGLVLAAIYIFKSKPGYFSPSGSAASSNPFSGITGSVRNLFGPGTASKVDSTGATLAGVSGILKELPGLFKGFGDLFASYKKTAPANTPTLNAIAKNWDGSPVGATWGDTWDDNWYPGATSYTLTEAE